MWCRLDVWTTGDRTLSSNQTTEAVAKEGPFACPLLGRREGQPDLRMCARDVKRRRGLVSVSEQHTTMRSSHSPTDDRTPDSCFSGGASTTRRGIARAVKRGDRPSLPRGACITRPKGRFLLAEEIKMRDEPWFHMFVSDGVEERGRDDEAPLGLAAAYCLMVTDPREREPTQ